MKWKEFTFTACVILILLLPFVIILRDISRVSDVATSPESQPNIILLLGYPRSGSSFSGSLMALPPDTLYLFEPLWLLNENVHNYWNDSSGLGTEAEKLIEDILNCEQEAIARIEHHPLIIQKVPLGFDDFDLTATCDEDIVKVIKTIRFRMSNLKSLLKQFNHMKVVHVVRDPRGTFNSMRSDNKALWVGERQNFDVFCRVLEENLQTNIPSSRLFLLKYEDLVEKTKEELQKLYAFLGQEFTEEISRKVYEHQHIEEYISTNRTWHRDGIGGHHFNTYRGSNFKHDAWKGMSLEDIRMVEQLCKGALTALGYELYEENEKR